MRRFSWSVSAESAGSRPPMSANASSSVIGSSDIADHASLARPVEQRLEKRLRGRLLAAEAQHREHGRRARRPQQLLEQDHAIGVGPLQIVDPHDERSASRQPAQQLSQRLECPPAESERIDAARLLSPSGHSRWRPPAAAPGTHASTPAHRAASASRHARGESTRDSGSNRRRRRRAPCMAPTRSRSIGPRARRHRRARRTG